MKVVYNEEDIKKSIEKDMDERGITVEAIQLDLDKNGYVEARIYVKNND